MLNRIFATTLLILMTACAQHKVIPTEAVTIDDLALRYLPLELSMGELVPGHVDAYFGPQELKTAAIKDALSLEDIVLKSGVLTAELEAMDTNNGTADSARVDGLLARLLALETRVAIKQGQTIGFDEEIKRLFATSLPRHDAKHFDNVIQEIDLLIPGEGPLNERIEAFMEDFTIPEEKLAAVIDASIAECRRRTVAFIELPKEEHFTVEYVKDKPWGGYNWYQGDSVSLIQINTDFPTRISTAVTLGCHEGYPGHHVYNSLLEQNLVKEKGWPEFSLYPLFSPQSLIAEGSGNYGINLAFPGDERIEFEKRVLFPLAGLDPESADDFYRFEKLLGQLNFSRNDAARDFLNGDADSEQTIQQLMKYGLTTRERAEQSLSFIKTYRSYVINYNHGKAMVADYIERGTDSPADRWKKFEAMLSTPMLPVDLEK